jgi:teichuronic acid biosynthesis glycosyltransferase TuaH
MKVGQPIVFFSLPRHDGEFTSTPWQLAVEMAKHQFVIFADHPYSVWEGIKGFYKASIRKRWKAYIGNRHYKKNGVNVLLLPFIWPINFLPNGILYNFLSAWNHRMVAKRINQFLRQEEIHSFCYVNSFNFYFPELVHFLLPKPALSVYHCIDPMVKPFTLKHGKRLQEHAAKKADLIISTAPVLQRQFIQPGFPKSWLVPNAADAQLFSQALNPSLKIHPLLADLKGRVMGFLGNIERRTDFRLLTEVVNQLPEWQLVMAGPCETTFVPTDLLSHPRIHWLGPVAHQQTPAVVKRFDVALIPFVCDDVSAGIYPLKLYEYLAAGKPVVSTRFNTEILNEIGDHINVARNAVEFAQQVQEAYATETGSKAEKRTSIAWKNTWAERAAAFAEIIFAEEKEKNVTKGSH